MSRTMSITWPLLAALSLLLSVSAENYTYERVLFPGVKLVCDRCPPDTSLLVLYTETNCTMSFPCSADSYWNGTEDCLLCDLCALNQEETQPCTITHNRVCQCKEGYYWLSHSCRKHTVCPAGHGIKSKGTPTEDTQCEPCVNDHYAAGAAGSKQCTPHTPCQSEERLVIKGSNWHNNICVTCDDLTTQGWSRHIKAHLLSELFTQQKSRRLQRVVQRLLPFRTRGTLPEFQEWLSGAPEESLTRLPDKLTRAKLHNLSAKVEHIIKKVQEEAKYCIERHISEIVLIDEGSRIEQ